VDQWYFTRLRLSVYALHCMSVFLLDQSRGLKLGWSNMAHITMLMHLGAVVIMGSKGQVALLWYGMVE